MGREDYGRRGWRGGGDEERKLMTGHTQLWVSRTWLSRQSTLRTKKKQMKTEMLFRGKEERGFCSAEILAWNFMREADSLPLKQQQSPERSLYEKRVASRGVAAHRRLNNSPAPKHDFGDS